MTTPLQQAFEAAQAEPEASAPIVCTVAGPRTPYSAQLYTGEELRPTSARPGAYDALTLPSVFMGRRVAAPAASTLNFVHTSGRRDFLGTKAEGQRFTAIAPAAQGDQGNYLPKPGSVPSLVLAHLQEHGGHLTYSEITQRFGIPQSSTTAVFKKALDSGALVRLLHNERVVIALPGYTPPPDTPKPSKDLIALQARIEKRRQEVAAMERELAQLQSRALRELITK
ncbi:MarR family transcriptional regulator [Acidovorax cavernicola]|uniref:Uncharacterized protein n=1 Tax=Acidovorax cavernicola TaxID=1675792 RepID=A0A9X8D0E5_9BURK|nr:MarR family transcriptional regulator [Acidovorax cavernicola]RIX74447.1 hypothetical protein D3H34_27330 [Acidovorax cavernicola]